MLTAVNFQSLEDLLNHKSDLKTKLCELGDNIGLKLVSWTKKLPFYKELSVELHTQLLTSKWHELLVLASCTYQAIYGTNKLTSFDSEAEFRLEVRQNPNRVSLISFPGRKIFLFSI